MTRKPAFALAALLVATAGAHAQTADEIIAKHLEARGGKDKIGAVQSARFTGRMGLGQGLEAPVVLTWKRPNMIRMEFTMQGMTGIQAYDGTSGWMVMPFLGKKDPEKMSEDDTKDIAQMADFIEGDLFDYQKKGHTVELLGKEAIEGTETWKLKVTKQDGTVTTMYLDSEAFLEIKSESRRKMRGSEVDIESTSGDYKEVGGLIFAHSYESKQKGAPAGQVITIDKIELGADVKESDFAMPAVAPKAEEAPAVKPPSR
jgi:outer membrane lipoprotein-sorting protein